ncbi:sushi, von Willebrand factor type A, EGF and pentraxin domain-containing protein 1 [Lingula anatina]|uniref:Metalloendopeptidase n=1 Tax=Lingula anatina TaxID=7574 RepID=A0A1S3IMU3_LINAN|nr:sushi, von Willebrand factor type A, EGF and pentraxin domain-containing protein 1 [Lingula anatina]|eukprot:XP_013399408.1 sushi, von Willebrand factor type A, EGF and pentraxin domain-containing protein 1 [Lingula anatina]
MKCVEMKTPGPLWLRSLGGFLVFAIALSGVTGRSDALPLEEVEEKLTRHTRATEEEERLSALYGDNFEGDIVLPTGSRNAIRNFNQKWTKGVVPYVIEGNVASKGRRAISAAIADYNRFTCIRFIPRTNENAYVSFSSANQGCYSSIGRTGRKQIINLQNSGCYYKDIVIHEMMHAIGFWHEQSRPDRDTYIRVLFQNVKSGKQHNFNIARGSTTQQLPYDYHSVMHYSRKAFSKNGKPTLESKTSEKIDPADELTSIDKRKIAFLYYCEGRDFNECQVNNGGCQQTCLNTEGSFRCTCRQGYNLTADGKTCKQTWTCATYGCQHYCNQQNVTYEPGCSCKTGFKLNDDKRTCSDIDECASGQNSCSDICVNEIGSYHCECPTGKILANNRTSCIDPRPYICPQPPSPLYGSNDCDKPSYQPDSVCIQSCPQGFNMIGDATMTCQDNGAWTNLNTRCEDINECETNSGGCNELCFNHPGGYNCGCNRDGFSLDKDGKTCIDTEPPVITLCSRNIAVPTLPTQDFAMVTFEEVKYTDNVRATVISGPPSNIANLPIGIHQVKYVVADEAGNNATCAFVIQVKDVEDPVFSGCPASRTIYNDQGVFRVLVNYTDPVASDNSGNVTVRVTSPEGKMFPFGTTTVTYLATDDSDNYAICRFTVSVTRPAACPKLADPINGHLTCFAWAHGYACTPHCDEGYEFLEAPPTRYVCGPSGVWFPNATVPSCYSEYMVTEVNSECKQ